MDYDLAFPVIHDPWGFGWEGGGFLNFLHAATGNLKQCEKRECYVKQMVHSVLSPCFQGLAFEKANLHKNLEL